MKKLLLGLMFVILFPTLCIADTSFHIGVFTDSVSHGEDTYRGAERIIKEYGEIKDGGIINLKTRPDAFMEETETIISQIISFADDPKMKAIIVHAATPGTVEAFSSIREIRPDILLFAGDLLVDPVMLADVADFVVDSDQITRGYTIISAAKKLGADTFVHVSYPRHMSMELKSRRRDIMREVCNDLGIKFIDMGSPDPIGDVGISGSQLFIYEHVPIWLEEYGDHTAFFFTNTAHTEPAIRQIARLGGIFIEADTASPTVGYPGALGIEFEEADQGNWPAILKKVEDKVIEAGGAGRMGTWVYSFTYSNIAGLVEHAIRVIEEKSELLNKDDFLKAISKYTPGAAWNSSYYIDADDVVRKNFLLVYQDTYVFGKGYLHMTSEIVPEKYYNIGR